MAKVKSMGYVDTPIEGVTTLPFLRGLLNFAKDFRMKSNTGKEAVLTNITSPVDRPERIKIAVSEIANIYSGSGIDPSILAPTKKGTSLMVELKEIISITDDADPTYRQDLPVHYHIVARVPNSEYYTADDFEAGVGRLLSCLYDTGSSEDTRLKAILRGSLVPSDL